MATIQVDVDDGLKTEVDFLFDSLGLDISTAVNLFFNAALETDGIPFEIKHKTPRPDLLEAIEDSRNRRNLSCPYKTAEEAVAAMLEE